MTRLLGRLALACLAVGFAVRAGAESFDLVDGDRVVLLGDSNTANGGYVQTSEVYTLLRFPTRNVVFINAGVGGDTMVGGAARLASTVLNHNPTKVIVTYGINDIINCIFLGEPEKTTCINTAQSSFINAAISIVNQCKAANVRVYMASYPVLGLGQQVNDTLQTFGYIAHYVALVLGERAIDVHANMRAVVGGAPTLASGLYAAQDFVPGVHLAEKGHNLWAYALLKALNAPAEVSSVTIDAGTLTGSTTGGATVSNISGNQGLVNFSRLDPGLPITFGSPAAAWGTASIPWVNISAYNLKVTNLQAGTYEIRAEGRLLGSVPHTTLAAGFHVATLQPNFWGEGGPWVVQATAVRSLVQGRSQTAFAQAWGNQLTGNPSFGPLQSQYATAQANLQIVQHMQATPWAFAFEVKRVGP